MLKFSCDNFDHVSSYGIDILLKMGLVNKRRDMFKVLCIIGIRTSVFDYILLIKEVILFV